MKRKLTVIIVLLFLCSPVYSSEPEKVLSGFFKSYRKKQFSKASGYLNLPMQGKMESRISEKALKDMWYTFYDRPTRIKNTEEVLRMNREETLALKEEIEFFKKDGATADEVEDISEQLTRMKANLRLIEALIDTVAEVSGPVISSKVVDDYCVIATRARVSFPGKYYKEISEFVSDTRLFMPTVADKYIELGKKTLTFPVVFYLIDTSKGWKLMLFSQDRFPAELFEDFLVDYDISFGQFQWMAGGQAQVFWEEASIELFKRKNK